MGNGVVEYRWRGGGWMDKEIGGVVEDTETHLQPMQGGTWVAAKSLAM